MLSTLSWLFKVFNFCLSSYGRLPPRGLPQHIILNSATEPAGQMQRQEKEESQTGRLRKDGIFNSTWAGKSQTTTITLGMSCLPTDHTHALQNPRLLYSQSTNGRRATHTPDLSAVFISDVGSLKRVRDTCKILGLPHMPLLSMYTNVTWSRTVTGCVPAQVSNAQAYLIGCEGGSIFWLLPISNTGLSNTLTVIRSPWIPAHIPDKQRVLSYGATDHKKAGQ